TKNGHPHVVPLSELAFGIVEEAGADFGSTNVNIVGKAIARGKWGIAPFTAHDLRRTALTKMAELGVAPIVLGHVANHRTTTRAGMTLSVYAHQPYEREKREAFEFWADRLGGIVAGAATVVAIKR